MPSSDPGDRPQGSLALARQVRERVLEMTSSGRSSHVGSGLSVADILAVLYADVLHVRPEEPTWPLRDRFVMSKGHAGAAVYAVLAESGFFDPHLLQQHYQNGSIFSGHVSHAGVKGVEVSTGSLGHGLSIATGMSWRGRASGHEWRAFALLSDGECDEGSTWEAAMFAGHHHLDNLVAIIDYNKMQSLATTDETLTLEPFADKWRAFGWSVVEVDGHDHGELREALAPDPGRPRCVLAHTTKGKGVSFMENQVLWHYRPPSEDELARALEELRA